MRPNVVQLRDGRLAVRADADTLLAVPPLHPLTPPAVREQVFDYVLRRQLGLAMHIAEAARDDIEGTARTRLRIASVMSQTPHRNRRGLGPMPGGMAA